MPVQFGQCNGDGIAGGVNMPGVVRDGGQRCSRSCGDPQRICIWNRQQVRHTTQRREQGEDAAFVRDSVIAVEEGGHAALFDVRDGTVVHLDPVDDVALRLGVYGDGAIENGSGIDDSRTDAARNDDRNRRRDQLDPPSSWSSRVAISSSAARYPAQ